MNNEQMFFSAMLAAPQVPEWYEPEFDHSEAMEEEERFFFWRIHFASRILDISEDRQLEFNDFMEFTALDDASRKMFTSKLMHAVLKSPACFLKAIKIVELAEETGIITERTFGGVNHHEA